MTNIKKFVSLEEILGRDDASLTLQKQDEFETEKVGLVPFTALDHPEYKRIKKQCFKMVANGTGGMDPELDDDKMNLRMIIAAVDKDSRSTFAFAKKELLAKLGVTTADEAVEKLLSPGEITRMSSAIQKLSGFGQQAAKDNSEAVKN